MCSRLYQVGRLYVQAFVIKNIFQVNGIRTKFLTSISGKLRILCVLVLRHETTNKTRKSPYRLYLVCRKQKGYSKSTCAENRHVTFTPHQTSKFNIKFKLNINFKFDLNFNFNLSSKLQVERRLTAQREVGSLKKPLKKPRKMGACCAIKNSPPKTWKSLWSFALEGHRAWYALRAAASGVPGPPFFNSDAMALATPPDAANIRTCIMKAAVDCGNETRHRRPQDTEHHHLRLTKVHSMCYQIPSLQ